jgi:hypothetical protein
VEIETVRGLRKLFTGKVKTTTIRNNRTRRINNLNKKASRDLLTGCFVIGGLVFKNCNYLVSNPRAFKACFHGNT